MIRHFVLTLNGAAQRLSTVLPDTTVNGPHDMPARSVTAQADGANAAPIYVGGENLTVSSSSWGQRIEAATATVPPAPSLIFGEGASKGLTRLSDWYVLGTNNEKLHLTVDFNL